MTTATAVSLGALIAVCALVALLVRAEITYRRADRDLREIASHYRKGS